MLSGLAPVWTVPSALQRLEIDDRGRVRATVAREAATELGRDGEAVHAGRVEDLPDDGAGFRVGDDDLRGVRHVEPMRGGVGDDVVPAAFAADRDLSDHAVAGIGERTRVPRAATPSRH